MTAAVIEAQDAATERREHESQSLRLLETNHGLSVSFWPEYLTIYSSHLTPHTSHRNSSPINSPNYPHDLGWPRTSTRPHPIIGEWRPIASVTTKSAWNSGSVHRVVYATVVATMHHGVSHAGMKFSGWGKVLFGSNDNRKRELRSSRIVWKQPRGLCYFPWAWYLHGETKWSDCQLAKKNK